MNSALDILGIPPLPSLPGSIRSVGKTVGGWGCGGSGGALIVICAPYFDLGWRDFVRI
jgi:hypothetical protein